MISRVQGIQSIVDLSDHAVDATQTYKSSQAQSDVSMFVVDQLDSPKLEAVHDVRFNVDGSTQIEEPFTINSSTQVGRVIRTKKGRIFSAKSQNSTLSKSKRPP